MSANEFSGQRVLVTGASSGIGRSTALLYAEAGAHGDLNDAADALEVGVTRLDLL